MNSPAEFPTVHAHPGARAHRNVHVLPIASLYDALRPVAPRISAGPIWPDWDDAATIPIRQMVHGVLNDAKMPVPEKSVLVPAANHFRIGLIIPHFGRFVAEVAARILPSLLAATLVFAVKSTRDLKKRFRVAK